MKLATTILLSILGTIGVSGTSVTISTDRAGRVPKEPPSTTVVVQEATSLSITTNTEITPAVHAQSVGPQQNVLTASYSFNERSARVKALQRALATVYVDGHYGNQTRRAHVAALKKNGLPTSYAPVPEKPEPRYNISYDLSHRCPAFEDSLRQHGLEPVEVFSFIAWRESRCNPKAVNAIWKNGKLAWTLNKDGSYDSGLLQINSSWKTVTSEVCGSPLGDLTVLRDLTCNLQVAKYIMDNSASKLGNWRVYRTN